MREDARLGEDVLMLRRHLHAFGRHGESRSQICRPLSVMSSRLMEPPMLCPMTTIFLRNG
jgi:hypothetical protein